RTLLNKLETEGMKLPYLKWWTSSGEVLTHDLKEDFYRLFPSSTHRLLNIYGSSEVTADVTCYDTSVDTAGEFGQKGNVPIGRPISNCRVYILNNNGAPQPTGIVGEIYVGGVQVAEG